MRHRKKTNSLSRTASHRRAMFANMASSLIKEKQIVTTLPKARALRRFLEPIITKSKNDSTHTRRQAFSKLRDKYAVQELFGEVRPKVLERPGGYTRILKLGERQGDAAEMALIELVDFNEYDYTQNEGGKSKKKTRRRRGGGGGSSADSKQKDTKAKQAEAKLDNAEVQAESIEETAAVASAQAEEHVAETVEETVEAAENAAETVADDVKNAVDEATEQVEAVAEELAETAQEATEAVDSALDDASKDDPVEDGEADEEKKD